MNEIRKISKTQQIIEMLEQGIKPKDIANKLDCYDSTVYRIKSQLRQIKRIRELELQVNK